MLYLRTLLAVLSVSVIALAVPATAQADTVLASFYGGESGPITASGLPYDPEAYVCAHPTLDFGTILLIEYGEAWVTCEVIDRGPYVDGRGLDMSEACARFIDLIPAGVDLVEVSVTYAP